MIKSAVVLILLHHTIAFDLAVRLSLWVCVSLSTRTSMRGSNAVERREAAQQSQCEWDRVARIIIDIVI